MPEEIVRVLSIEDNADYAQFIRDTLYEATALGWNLPQFKLTCADTLAAALARLDEDDVNVVLSDLDLPDSQAGDTFAQLRAHVPDMPIVVLTGRDDETLARHTLRAGAADYLFKHELSGSLLAHALLYAIERQRARAALQEARDDLEHQVQVRTAELEQTNAQLRQETAERTQAEEGQRKALAEVLQATQALRERENELIAIYDGVPFIILLLDIERRVRKINRAALEMLDRTLDSTIGLRGGEVLGCIHALDDPQGCGFGIHCANCVVRNTVLDTLKTGQRHDRVEAQMTLKTAGGSATLWLLVSALPLNVSGEERVLVCMEDMTKRKRAEVSLRQSEAKTRAILNVIPDLMFHLAQDGTHLDFYAPDRGLLFVQPEDFIGKRVNQVLPDDVARKYQEHIQRCLDSGQMQIFEYWLDFAEKGKRDYEARMVVSEDDQVLTIVRDVTERVRSEQERMQATHALQKSEERFRLMTETIPDIVFQLDLEGRVTYCSPSVERMLGFTPDKVVGTHLARFFPTDVLNQALQNFEKATAVARVDILEAEILNHAGLPVTIEAYLVPILRDEQVIGVQGIARDITERKRAEEALRESEAKYHTLFEGMAQGVFYQRADGALVDVNPAALEMFGLTHAQFLGRTSLNPQWHVIREDGGALPGESHPSMVALKTGEPVRGMIIGVYNPRREEHVWLSVNAIPQFKPGEDTPYQAFVTLHDITQRKQFEEALNKSRQDLQMTLDATTDGIWTWHFETNELFFSPRYYTMLGYEPNEFPSSFQGWQDLVHPDDLQSAQATADQWLQTKLGRYENDFRLKTKAGDYRWIHARGMVVERDSNGRAIRMIGNHEDITARKQTKMALEKTVAELARSNADLEQFAYVISHDLREPLRAVTSYLQLLENRYAGQLDEKADKFIAYAVGGAVRMHELINGLLAYSRVGTRAEPFVPIDCEAILNDALADLKVFIEERRAVVTSDPLPSVVADGVQLGQVFQNLISNAVKFCREEPPRVHVSAKQEGDVWVFTVKDNGIGIDPAQTERIFGVFQRLHTPEEYPGTGMGLPICKRIVERHGGRIWVHASSPDQGSTFCFTLPVQEDPGI